MVTRINGFSGMDIDSMVKNLMTAKRAPLNKLNQQKQILQWTRDSYREINSKLYDFKTNKLTEKYGKSEAMNSNKAVTSGNAEALKAEASAEATGIDMKVSITQLATKTTVATAGAGSQFKSSSTLAEVQAPIDGSDPTSVTAKAKNYNLVVNGEKFTFKGDTSIATVLSTINASAKAEVTAKFDEVTGKLLIESKTSGPSGKVDLGAGISDNSLLEIFNKKNQVELLWEKTNGKKAILFVNDTKIEKDSNSFEINGIQLNLLKETTNITGPSIDPSSGTVTDNPIYIKTQINPDKTLESIKGFVEDYNTLISLLNNKVGEAKYRDFPPLTDEQKADLKEDDIKAWTEKAKSGLLKNDEIIRSLVSSMRSIISEKMGDLSDIGITTGTYIEGGRLFIDETKLKKAVSENPQKMIDLFQGPASASDTGIFDKLAEKVNTALYDISERAGTNRFSADLSSTYKEESVMGRKLKDYNSRISTMLRNLQNAENRYYKQFTAMETAMSKLNSQSSNLLSSLGIKQ